MIKNFTQLYIAICIICYIIYARIRKLNFTVGILDKNTLLDILFVECLCMIFLFLACYAIYKISNKNTKATTNSKQLFIYINNILIQIYYQPLLRLDFFFKEKIYSLLKKNRVEYTNVFVKHLYIQTMWNQVFIFNNKYFIGYFLLKYAPKIIIALVFLLDIFYYNKFFYFYWSLPLLLLNLLTQYFIYICFEDYNKFVTLAEEKLEIIDIKTPEDKNMILMLSIKEYLNNIINIHLKNETNPYEKKIGLTYQYFKTIPDELLKTKKINFIAVKDYYRSYLLFAEILHTLRWALNTFDTKINPKVNLFVYSCYFVGWGYILYNLLLITFPHYFVYLPNENNPFI